MNTSTDPADTSAPPIRPDGWRRWWRNRTELGFAGGVLAIAVFLTIQTVQMEVPEGSGSPGPQFFPGLIAGFLFITGGLLAIDVIRTPRHTSTEPTTEYIPVDFRTTGTVLGALVVFALLLRPVGWLITAGALFWVVSRALGSRRPVFDIAVSAIFASVIQIAFSAGLGLGLPPGILEGVLPWSN